jgi:hypothetical protein
MMLIAIKFHYTCNSLCENIVVNKDAKHTIVTAYNLIRNLSHNRSQNISESMTYHK